jgi:amino acid transporter
MGEKKPPSTLFVRRASGLVREMSTTSASFYNIIASVGGALGNANVVAASLPLFVVQIGAWVIPGYSVGMGIMFFLALVFVGIFVCLVSVMPRTGGDYVFTSRITNPFLGWLEGWGLVWTTLGFIGTAILMEAWNVSGTVEMGVAVMGFSSWTPWVAWWSSLPGVAVVSIVVIVAILLQHVLPARAYFRSFTYLVLAAFIMMMFMIPLFIGATPAKFEMAFQHFSGITPQQLASQATTAGATYVPFSFGSLGTVTAAALFMFIGFQYSIYFAGELKGNVSRNAVVSVLSGLICVAFVNSIYVAIIFGLMGWGGVLTNWGYLFWAGQAPLNGVWPFVPLLGALLTPNLAVLAFIAAFGNILTNILILSAWSALISRLVFAWSMDRVIPSWFAAVNPRTKSPIRLIVLACVAIFVVAILTSLGANPTVTIWFTVIMAILSWFMPGFNAILLPFRRKDLFELAPSWARKKIAGVYLLPVLGVIWVLFMFWDYIISFVAPFVSAVTTAGLSGFAGYAISTGIVGVIVTNVAGAVIWFASKWYNRKKGIAFGQIFSQIPPE